MKMSSLWEWNGKSRDEKTSTFNLVGPADETLKLMAKSGI